VQGRKLEKRARLKASLARPTSLGESGRITALAAEISTSLVRVSFHDIDEEINRWLKHVAVILGLDRCTIAEFKVDGSAFFSHGWVRDDAYRVIGMSLDANTLLPWSKAKMLAGQTIVTSSMDDLPEEAVVDRESQIRFGTKSNVVIPIKVDDVVLAGVGFATTRHNRSWPPTVVQQLQKLAIIFGYAFERKRATHEIMRLQSELTHVSRVNTIGELAASIVHELNQPLAAILNNAEAVQIALQTDNPDLEEVRAAITDIIQDDTRASETSRRLRSLFRHDKLEKINLNLGNHAGPADHEYPHHSSIKHDRTSSEGA
jgi:GAF domain-containing protein